MSSLNKKLTSKTELKQAPSKKLLEARDLNKMESSSEIEKFIFSEHPGAKLLRGSQPNTNEFRKFTTLLYRGLYYSVNNLKGPSE